MVSFLRFDPTTLDWVIFAPDRVRRPEEFRTLRRRDGDEDQAESVGRCPFCPGNEAFSPVEIHTDRRVGERPSDWRIRVVANRSPALRIEEDHRRVEDRNGFRFMEGCGAHEVIIESREHFRRLADQSAEQVERVLRTVQFRSQDLLRDPRFQTVVVFKNQGEAAGTSLVHPHWQLIATPVVPRLLRLKHSVATDYFDQTGECLYCRMLQRELSDGRRILAANDAFVALIPYASHTAFETWILPRHHRSSFAGISIHEVPLLAGLLRSVLRMLDRGLENPDYNLTIDTAARGDESKEFFLWHLRILPRLSVPAGFELGSGMSINTVLPEKAAEYLRSHSEQ